MTWLESVVFGGERGNSVIKVGSEKKEEKTGYKESKIEKSLLYNDVKRE